MRKIIIITVIILVIAAGVGAYLLSPSASSGTVLNKNCKEITQAQQETTAITVRTGCEQGEQAFIEDVTQILIRLPDDLAANNTRDLTPAAKDFLKDHNPGDILPTGVKLEILQESWRRTGTVGSITVKVSGPYFWSPESKFSVIFAKDIDGWKLSNTIKS